MAGSEPLIRTAIEIPNLVRWDVDYAGRENHYRWTTEGIYGITGGIYLKVCVEYGPDGDGLVITAYPTHRIKGREQQRWP